MNKKIFLSLSLFTLTPAFLCAGGEADAARQLLAIVMQKKVETELRKVNAQALERFIGLLSTDEQNQFTQAKIELGLTKPAVTPAHQTPFQGSYVPEAYRNYDGAGDRYTDTRHKQPERTAQWKNPNGW